MNQPKPYPSLHQAHLGRRSLVLLAGLFIALVQPLAATDLEKLLEKAERQLERGKYDKAVDTLRKAQEMDASSPAVAEGLTLALYSQARDLYQKGRSWDEAEDMLEEMLELTDNPEARTGAYKLLGTLSYQNSALPHEERLSRAEAAYREAMRLLGKDDWASRLSLAVVLRDRGEPMEALEHLRALPIDALEPDPKLAARSLICSLKSQVGAESEPTETPKMVGGGISKPQKLFSPAPQYTDRLRKRGIQGKVILQGVIDRDGCLTKLRTLGDSQEDLVPPVVDAVRQWLFDPARLNGQIVPVTYNLVINMNLSSRPPRTEPIQQRTWP